MDATTPSGSTPPGGNQAARGNNELGGTPRLETETWTPEEAVIDEGLPARAGTFRSLGHRDYRYFWIGALLSNVGTWMQMIALGALVVFVLKRTAISVGLVNFASSLPVFFLSLPAGALADSIDRRRLLMWLQIPLLACAVALGYLTQARIVTFPELLAITFAAGIATAFMFPAWQAMLPDLVPKSDLMNAIALNSAQFNSARLIGPALASLVLARLGYAAIFYINGVSFLAVVAALAFVHPKQERRPRSTDGVRRTLTEGLRYARANRCVGVYLLTVAVSTVFGFFYIYLMPLVAKSFSIGPQGLGYLMAASGGGAVAGALFVARLRHDTRKDVLVKTSLIAYGVLLVAFAYSPTPWIAGGILVLAGASFLAVTSGCNTAIQAIIPPHIRGRIMSLFVLAFMGMMPFSSLLAGVLGEKLGVSAAIAAGALVLIAHGLLLTAKPSLLEPCRKGDV